MCCNVLRAIVFELLKMQSQLWGYTSRLNVQKDTQVRFRISLSIAFMDYVLIIAVENINKNISATIVFRIKKILPRFVLEVNCWSVVIM